MLKRAKLPRALAALLPLVVGLGSVGALRATPIVAVSMGTTTPNGANSWLATGLTAGWEFSLSSAITVVDLGVFDNSQANGLGEAHAVGIWNTSGTLLVSGTVPAGTAGTLINSFFYVGVTSTVLPAGTYIIATEYDTSNTDPMYGNLTSSNFSTASPVTWIQDEAGGNGVNVLTFPTFTSPPQEDGFFGPNFEFTTSVSASPEPPSGWLLGSVLAAMAAGAGYRKLRKSRA